MEEVCFSDIFYAKTPEIKATERDFFNILAEYVSTLLRHFCILIFPSAACSVCLSMAFKWSVDKIFKQRLLSGT